MSGDIALTPKLHAWVLKFCPWVPFFFVISHAATVQHKGSDILLCLWPHAPAFTQTLNDLATTA